MSWPFADWQAVAVRRFQLSPTEFWAMPVREWLALLKGAKPSGFERSNLDNLMLTYPDEGTPNEHD